MEVRAIRSKQYRKGGYLLVTPHSTQPGYCYEWSDAGGKNKNAPRVYCKGCRSIKNYAKEHWPQGESLKSLPVSKIDEDRYNFESDPDDYPHVCEPKKTTQVIGESIRKEELRKITIGGASTKPEESCKNMNEDILREFADEDEQIQKEIYQFAVGKKKNVKRAMYRATNARFQTVKNFKDLRDNHPNLHLSLRGKYAKKGSPFFEDKHLLYCQKDMVIFATKRQLLLFRKSKHIVCDGTFGYAPVGKEKFKVQQIYRIFGFVKDKSFPLITALMVRKDQESYDELWRQLYIYAEGKNIHIESAHFDYEPAAINSFRKYFDEFNIKTKMCLFHTKQALDRQVKSKSPQLYNAYREMDNVKKIVRMIGAQQFLPQSEMKKGHNIINKIINDDRDLTKRQKQHLVDVNEYYEQTWIQNKIGFDFFTLFGFEGPRTTNAAEYYHSKQSHVFRRKKLPLGEWIVTFQKVSGEEERHAMAIREGSESPNVRNDTTIKINEKLAKFRRELTEYLLNEHTQDEYNVYLSQYMARVGRAVGIDPREFKKKDPNLTLNNSTANIVPGPNGAIQIVRRQNGGQIPPNDNDVTLDADESQQNDSVVRQQRKRKKKANNTNNGTPARQRRQRNVQINHGNDANNGNDATPDGQIRQIRPKPKKQKTAVRPKPIKGSRIQVRPAQKKRQRSTDISTSAADEQENVAPSKDPLDSFATIDSNLFDNFDQNHGNVATMKNGSDGFDSFDTNIFEANEKRLKGGRRRSLDEVVTNLGRQSSIASNENSVRNHANLKRLSSSSNGNLHVPRRFKQKNPRISTPSTVGIILSKQDAKQKAIGSSTKGAMMQLNESMEGGGPNTTHDDLSDDDLDLVLPVDPSDTTDSQTLEY